MSGATSPRPPSDAMPTTEAVLIPESLDPSSSVSANARALLEARLSRPLTAAEAQQLDAALVTALSVLQSGGDAAHRRLIATDMARALLTPAAAQLWAVVVEAAVEGDVPNAAAFGEAVEAGASTIAGALLVSAFGSD